MDKNQYNLNSDDYFFLTTDKTTKLFNSNKTGANFSFDLYTGEQEYDIDNAYELSYQSTPANPEIEKNNSDFNLEKSLKKIKCSFERATRYCNSRVPSMNRHIISQTFDHLLKSKESAKYMIDKQITENYSKNNPANKNVNKIHRKSNFCLKLSTSSSTKLKWNTTFVKRTSLVNVSKKHPTKNRTQILRQKDIAVKYKQYLKPTNIAKNMKQKLTYTDRLKLFERSSMIKARNEFFGKSKKSVMKKADSIGNSPKMIPQKQIPSSKLKSNNLCNPQKGLINKLLKPISYNRNIIIEPEIIINNENKSMNSAVPLSTHETYSNEEIQQIKNLDNFSTHTVNTVTMSPLIVRSECIQTENNLIFGRPTTDAQSQTLPLSYHSNQYYHIDSQQTGINFKDNSLKRRKESCLHFHDIEKSFKNICSVLSIKSLLVNKNDTKENSDAINYNKSSSSSMDILQVYRNNIDNLTKGITENIKNDGCHLTVEKNKLSLDKIHLNKTKILNMQICTSNDNSLKISKINLRKTISKSSEKSCPSSSDELYQAIRSKIDRVLSGGRHFTEDQKTCANLYTKKSCLKHREEVTRIVNEKNHHYLSKSLSRDSFEAISKCGKHSKMNSNCKLVKTLAYRIQRLELQALHEQALRLKQQKRLNLLEKCLREVYMLVLTDDKTAVKTLAAIKQGFCHLNTVKENKILPKSAELRRHTLTEMLKEPPLQTEVQHCYASNK